jgi:hypothetical protein
MIYLVTGQPGTGKSTIAVEHAINRYLVNGRRVCSNFPIDVSPICATPKSKLSSAVVRVIPDRPSRADLDAIGYGCETQREEDFGLLIIDEAGVWLSARSWNGNQREEIIDWLSQSRKRGWDIIIIAQGSNMIDKQVREAICEGIVRIRRLDRMKVLGVSMPRMHIAVVRYGLDANAPVIERWVYRGGQAHKCFGSYRLFGADSTHYSVLPATLTKWRYAGTPAERIARQRAALWSASRDKVLSQMISARNTRRGPQLLPIAAAVRASFLASAVSFS